MNVAIIDDLREDIMLTEKYIRNYFTNYHSSIKPDIDLYSSGEEFLDSFKPHEYQIIFIDIYMNGITGIQTAKEIFKEDKSACIIFLTTSDEHYAESFSVHSPSEKEFLGERTYFHAYRLASTAGFLKAFHCPFPVITCNLMICRNIEISITTP